MWITTTWLTSTNQRHPGFKKVSQKQQSYVAIAMYVTHEIEAKNLN